jgi:hypothetical protein
MWSMPLQAALRSLQIMGLDVAATYTALHLRMGGLIGEQVTLHHDLKYVPDEQGHHVNQVEGCPEL